MEKRPYLVLLTVLVLLGPRLTESGSTSRNRCHHVNCPPGYGISGPCFVDEPPPVCRACPPGTFSSHFSRSAKCRPCKSCDPHREMVLWNCSSTLDSVCIKVRRFDGDGSEVVIRPRILMQPPLSDDVVADIYNRSRQQHAERLQMQEEMERLRAENMTSLGNETSDVPFEATRAVPTSWIPESDTETSQEIITASSNNYERHTTAVLATLDVVYQTKYDDSLNLQEIHITKSHSPAIGIYTALISTASLTILVVGVAVLVAFYKRKQRRCQRLFAVAESHRSNGYPICPIEQTGSASTVVTEARKKTKNTNKELDNPNILRTTRGPIHDHAPVLDQAEAGQVTNDSRAPSSQTPGCEIRTLNELEGTNAQPSATHTSITNQNPDNIYGVIFEGQFDYEGGWLSHAESDVKVYIPRGAIPRGRLQKIVVKVSLAVSYFNVNLSEGQIPLAPVVECLSPGLDAFLDYVTVMVPHRAILPGSNSKWRFLVHFNQSMNPRDKDWRSVDQSTLSAENNIVRPVTFSVDEKYVNIRTKHFTKFTCSSCGKERPQLALNAIAYGKFIPETGQVEVKVYICDTIKDTEVKVEGAVAHKSVMGLKAADATADWTVKCVNNPEVKSWDWGLNDCGGHLDQEQTITMDDIVSCCSESHPPCAQYTFESSMDDDKIPNYFKVSFILEQCVEDEANRPKKKLLQLGFPTNGGDSEELLVPEDTVCKPDALQRMTECMLAEDVKSLVRALLPNYDSCDTKFGDIDQDHRGSIKEQKYQYLLFWQQTKGSEATYSEIFSELKRQKMSHTFDALREIYKKQEKVTVVRFKK